MRLRLGLLFFATAFFCGRSLRVSDGDLQGSGDDLREKRQRSQDMQMVPATQAGVHGLNVSKVDKEEKILPLLLIPVLYHGVPFVLHAATTWMAHSLGPALHWAAFHLLEPCKAYWLSCLPYMGIEAGVECVAEAAIDREVGSRSPEEMEERQKQQRKSAEEIKQQRDSEGNSDHANADTSAFFGDFDDAYAFAYMLKAFMTNTEAGWAFDSMVCGKVLKVVLNFIRYDKFLGWVCHGRMPWFPLSREGEKLYACPGLSQKIGYTDADLQKGKEDFKQYLTNMYGEKGGSVANWFVGADSWIHTATGYAKVIEQNLCKNISDFKVLADKLWEKTATKIEVEIEDDDTPESEVRESEDRASEVGKMAIEKFYKIPVINEDDEDAAAESLTKAT